MTTISNGAQLNELAIKCSNSKNELAQISISLNNENKHLTQNLNTQLETANENIMVKYYFLYN